MPDMEAGDERGEEGEKEGVKPDSMAATINSDCNCHS